MFSWLLGAGATLLIAAVIGIGLVESRVDPGVIEERDGDTLVVLLHGFTLDPASLAAVRKTMRTLPEYSEAEFLVPQLPFGLLSMARAEHVVADLLMAIDAAWQKRLDAGRGYRRLILVGHSMGALYARKVYAVAAGENPQAPFEPELHQALRRAGAPDLHRVRDWVPAVERIVLLAGMNRGWSISHHMSPARAASMWFGTGISWILDQVHGRPPIVFSIRRGAPFITQLRLQWLSLRKHAGAKGTGSARTIQLLGTIDDLVAPDDNIDLVSGGDFVYLDVPHSGHADVIAHDDPVHGLGRSQTFAAAVTLSDFREIEVEPAGLRMEPNTEVDDVVFVIHGIRDEGYWTDKIARRIVVSGRKQGREIATETSSYGYFPMLSFLRPRARQEKVEWLMDRYTEALARYPRAEFSYVGHSHGTYLLARALQDYPAVHFKNVVFAGSVVNRSYEWSRLLAQGRAQRVVNFVATADWVVAFFPKALQILGYQDLGGAGHDGFDEATTAPALLQASDQDLGGAGHDGFDEATTAPALLQASYVIGGHSAALQEALWQTIADFVVDGELRQPPEALLADKQSPWIALPAAVAPLIWVVLGVIVVLLLRLLLHLPVQEWQKTLLVIGYVYTLWIVLTRV